MDVWKKAHIGLAIGFIQDQHFGVRQIDVSVTEEVEQTPRTGDHDLGAAPQRRDLAIPAYAPIHGYAAYPGLPGQIDTRPVDLFGEFARGRDDQDTHPVHRTFGQPLQDGQGKGCRSAGAHLCQAQHIAPFEHNRDSLPLDGRGSEPTPPSPPTSQQGCAASPGRKSQPVPAPLCLRPSWITYPV
jgi:hypothetical protein